MKQSNFMFKLLKSIRQLIKIGFFVRLYLRSYVGRSTAASTATGSKAQHNKELASLLEAAYTF